MNVRTVCLAVLQFGEASGYDIRKLSVEGTFSQFVDASFGAIYPALARLEQDGLVTSRLEAQPGRPAARLYRLTPAGRQELVAMLSRPPAADIYRSEFLLVAVSARILPPETVAAAIDSYIARMEADIAQVRDAADTAEDPAARWALGYGLAVHHAAIDFLRRNRAGLIGCAETAPDTAAPDTAASDPATESPRS